MGLNLQDVNEKQRAFVEVLRQDPDKGAQWIKLLDAALCGFELILVARQCGEELGAMMVTAVSASITNAVNRVYPCDTAINPRNIELRTDTVTFYSLDGTVVPPDARWDEKSRSIKVVTA